MTAISEWGGGWLADAVGGEGSGKNHQDQGEIFSICLAQICDGSGLCSDIWIHLIDCPLVFWSLRPITPGWDNLKEDKDT